MNYGEQQCCSLCSEKGEPVEIKVRAGNLLALINKDSVGILRGFLLGGAQLLGAKKLHSSLATCKRRFARAALQCVFCTAMLTHSAVFYKSVHEFRGVWNVMSKKKEHLKQLREWWE